MIFKKKLMILIKDYHLKIIYQIFNKNNLIIKKSLINEVNKYT